MKKPTNHLASQTERLANYRLPYQKKLLELQQLTIKMKKAWQCVLPTEVLTALLVIDSDNAILSLSTNNHTIANHLNYNQQQLLALLHDFDMGFKKFEKLKFRVINLKDYSERNSQNLQCNQDVNNVNKCELSEFTKQNIAQLCELVTVSHSLKAALQKLIKN